MNRASFDFGGHRVLVTGGTSGIGNAIALAFRDAGADVVATGTRPKAADYDDVDLDGVEYRQLLLDDGPSVTEFGSSFDVLDVLVNNAGAGRVDEWEPDGFEAAIATNLAGAFRLTMACKPALLASHAEGGASVVYFLSVASFAAVPIVPGYGAAKAGLLQLNRNLAVSWATEGIRVNGVAPGVIETRMTSVMKVAPELAEEQMVRIPMQRFGSVDEVAPSVLFLCSAEASYITGQVLKIDGGRLAT